MKRYSTRLIVREIQVKTTMRYYLTPIRMTIIKKRNKKKPSVGEVVEKLEPLCIVSRNGR